MARAAAGEVKVAGQYPLTLVTAYFELGERPGWPGPENPYPRWIRNFLPLVRWPLVIFCDEQSVEMLKEARGGKPAVWHVTRPQEFYTYRYLDDLRRLPHFPGPAVDSVAREVLVTRSLIWHEKHHFLRQALSENPYRSEMFFWCDIGHFRHGPDAPWWPPQSALRKLLLLRLYEDIEWPNFEVCRSLLPQDKAVLVHDATYDVMNGGFYGGAIEPLRLWCDAYSRRLEWRKQNGSFSGSDECVMMSCWRKQPELAHIIPSRPAPYCNFLAWRRPRQACRWYFLSGRRFPWKYFCRRFFSWPAR